MPEIDPKDPFVQEVFRFLEVLRDSGVTNMFGAAPYLSEAYGFPADVSRKFLAAWMDSFKDNA